MYPLIMSKYSLFSKGRNIGLSLSLSRARFNRNDGRTNVTHTCMYVMSIVRIRPRARLAVTLYSSAMYPDARDFHAIGAVSNTSRILFRFHPRPRSHLYSYLSRRRPNN